jgi:tRNA-Thr(GGU) m(6)t(6)A37 methyltransferase TsaA
MGRKRTTQGKKVFMSDNQIIFRPIGIIRTEHTNPEATPIQPIFAKDCEGCVMVAPEFVAGLADIEDFSHVYLVYHLHKVSRVTLVTKPFMQDKEHGVFATRSPCRPNPIGLSIVRLVSRDGGTLIVKGADMLDGTPLLDIKPYTRRFDNISTERNGWQDEVDDATAAKLGVRNYCN